MFINLSVRQTKKSCWSLDAIWITMRTVSVRVFSSLTLLCCHDPVAVFLCVTGCVLCFRLWIQYRIAIHHCASRSGILGGGMTASVLLTHSGNVSYPEFFQIVRSANQMPEATVRRVLRDKKKNKKTLPTVFFSLGSCGSFNTCEVLDISSLMGSRGINLIRAVISNCFSSPVAIRYVENEMSKVQTEDS